jgi:putative DNA-binding protein
MQAADLQDEIAAAVVSGSGPARAPIVGGRDPVRRFAIHARHYAASVTRAVVERFAATAWLVGSKPLVDAATAFVREHPPRRPCMAEYGDAFPTYLASCRDGRLPPYVGPFATIDWHAGRIAIAADAPAITSLAGCEPARIGDASLALQDGVAYVEAQWSLDELMSFYLSGTAPDEYVLRSEPAFMEVRGSRGELRIQRLACGDFIFRSALARGATLADAAAAAVDADETFAPAHAVTRLLGEGLVTGVRKDTER